MNQGLTMIHRLVRQYKRYEGRADVALKFFGGLVLFFVLSGLSMGQLGFGKRLLLTVIPAAVTVVASPMVVLLLAALVACFSVFVVSVQTAALLFFLLCLLFVFYIRLFPLESLIFPAMVVAYAFHLPQIVVLIAALYVGVKAIVPVGAAVFFWYHWPLMKELMALSPRANFTPMGSLDTLLSMYEVIMQQADWMSWGSVWIVYLVVILAGWGISHLFLDWEREKALWISAGITVVGLCLAALFGGAPVSLLATLVQTAISAGLMYLVLQGEYVLDYPKAERVKFQDEHYVYYVKAVPKIAFPHGSRPKQP